MSATKYVGIYDDVTICRREETLRIRRSRAKAKAARAMRRRQRRLAR